jgi:hypothetical protein
VAPGSLRSDRSYGFSPSICLNTFYAAANLKGYAQPRGGRGPKRKTRSFSVDPDQGKISVVDITTGSEFIRIITMPNGVTVAASGWVNSWNEEQVRNLAVGQK